MSLFDRVLKNTAFVMGGVLLNKFLKLVVLMPVLTRHLGPEGFGLYNWAFAYVALCLVVSDFGINAILTRELSKEGRPHALLLGNAVMMRLALGLLAAGGGMAAAHLLGEPEAKLQALSVILLVIVLHAGFSFRCTFQATLTMGRATVVEFVGELVDLLLVIAVVWRDGPLEAIFAVRVLVDAAMYAAFYVLGKPLIRPEFRPRWDLCRELLSESAPLALNTVFTTVYLKVGQLLIEGMRGAEDLGYYGGSVRLVEALNLIPDSLMISLFPILSRFAGQEGGRARDAYEAAYKYMAIFVLPGALLVTGLAPWIVTTLFGADFLPGAPALAILIWGAFFVFIGRVTYGVLISEGKQRWITVLVAWTAGSNLALNFLLIPPYGPAGAAVASVAAYASMFAVAWFARDL
ncbi:MAG: flippase, partial [Candidatus Methylomirabilis sp.]|nr:flippase [Deltaproteobacteria bacterium]